MISPSSPTSFRLRSRPPSEAEQWKTMSQSGRASSGWAKSTPRASASSLRPGSRSTSWRRASGKVRSSVATMPPTSPAPITAMRSPSLGPASHSALTAVSTVPVSTARRGGTPSGMRVSAETGTTYRSWCGWRQKTVWPGQSVRPLLHDTDGEVAELHRRGKGAFLVRSPHLLRDALRNGAMVHHKFGALADSRIQRADQSLVIARTAELLGAQLALLRADGPVCGCFCVLRRGSHLAYESSARPPAGGRGRPGVPRCLHVIYARAAGPRAAVLGMGALLRYPSQVGDVSERPKVQHSKCCLVSKPTWVQIPPSPPNSEAPASLC